MSEDTMRRLHPRTAFMLINGAGFYDKMLRVKSAHISTSLSEIPRVFRSYVMLKRRQFCMAIKPQNELLRTENVNENNNDQQHVGNIRWFCKAERSPHEVANFFNQLRNLPFKRRTRSLNSALYWFLHYGKTKEALELNSLWETQGFPKSYSTYASLAILYARCRQLGNKGDFFDRMKLNGLTPRARHYEPFLAAATIRGDLMEAFESMSEMAHSSIIHEMSIDLYTSLIRACTGKEDNLLDNNVFKIFHYFMKYRTKLTDDALQAIKLWFDRRSQRQWITSWTITSPTFHCHACKQKLETGEFSKEELEELKLALVKYLWKPHKTLQHLKCFTSAGNFIDYVGPEQLNRIPLSLEHFVKNTGPYDVVIDGLNVGYRRGFFDPKNIQKVVLHFVKKRKRVLVVGSSPLRLSERTRKGKQTPLGALVEYLTVHEQCGLISLPECSLDDLYFLSAAMHCGPGTLLVSNDEFHDHKFDIDPLVRIHFNRWQRLNKLTLKGFVDESPLFTHQDGYDPAVQTNGDTWHFPSSDGNRWLCVQKAKN